MTPTPPPETRLVGSWVKVDVCMRVYALCSGQSEMVHHVPFLLPLSLVNTINI